MPSSSVFRSRPRLRRPLTNSPPVQPIDALTGYEEEVLLTVARDRTNAEIAEELYIGLSTTKTHVASLMTKLWRSQPRRGCHLGI